MIIRIALILSVALQFGAFFIALRLIPRTKFNISWITLSIGFFLMAMRRLDELVSLYSFNEGEDQDVYSSWIAVVTSLLMFTGSFYIRRIFGLQDRMDKMRTESETKVLSAIIETEEKERKAFAREVHDSLGPLLSSVKMTLSAVNKSKVDEVNRDIIDKAEYSVDSAIVAIKEISNKLSPHVLEAFGLEKAVKSFINSFAINEKIKFDLSFSLQGQRYNQNLEANLYRIICELVTNTLKHANASKVELGLFPSENGLELFYTDDGVGFLWDDRCDKGMGLWNIQSRVKSANGNLEIHTAPGRGFYLKITFPL